MQKPYHIYAVTKTHWDREWYMNYQKTRIRLVHLIDTLLEILDDDPDFVSFMLDGQTLPLEDYLEVKPENRARLEQYIRQGRIVIGPWYILPDEILITGETHIRNYLLGTMVARSFGAEKMQIGYLPDSFGHPSQMPQILSGLGMNTIVFWRGATEEVRNTEFYWRAPDGTRVLTVLMPDGYFTGAELSEDPDIVARRLDNYIERFAALSHTDKIYMTNGGDHLEPVPYLSRVLREANARMKRGTVRHTTLPRFVSDLQASLGDDIDEVTGELCGVHYSILLASTTSSRMYLKQANHDAARLLENYLEPMFAVAAQQGHPYPRGVLRRAWKYLMENQPHDSICGCSIDDIHRDMMSRYDQVNEIGAAMFGVAREFYADMDTSAVGGEVALTVMNGLGSARTDLVEAVVDFDPRPTSMNDYEHNDEKGNFPRHYVDNSPDALKPLPRGVRVFDGDRELPCTLLEAKVANWLDLGYARFPHQYNVNRCRIAFRAEDVPAMGYRTFRVEPVYEAPEPVLPGVVALENEFLRVEPSDDGTLNITDKRSGRIWKGLNALVDGGDCGDEYTYCPPDDDALVRVAPGSVTVRMVRADSLMQQMVLEGNMDIPADMRDRGAGRTSATERCPFSCEVTLVAGAQRVDVRMTLENRSCCHRLRVHFPTGTLAESCWSAGTFSVDERPVVPHIDPGWKELYFTHPQKDFCDAGDGSFGLTIANRGLHEFEAFNENGQTTLAVTLLRCTGVISQRVIKTRCEMGGWTEEAPGGQCLGTWTFEYSILPHEGTWEAERTYLKAREYNVPMQTVQVPGSHAGKLPAVCSMVEIGAPELIVSAFKQCEFEEGYILRCYNSTGKHVDTRVLLHMPHASVALANLREEPIGVPTMEGDAVLLSVRPFEIVTLRIGV